MVSYKLETEFSTDEGKLPFAATFIGNNLRSNQDEFVQLENDIFWWCVENFGRSRTVNRWRCYSFEDQRFTYSFQRERDFVLFKLTWFPNGN